MDFIELTHHGNKKRVSISISKIEAIFEVEESKYYADNSKYDHVIARIDLISGGYFDVDESYDTVMEMVNKWQVKEKL